MLALVALVGLAFGPAGRTQTEEMPDTKTHPYYPDHFWPYSILATLVLISLGLLAVFGQAVLQLGQAADPRLAVLARPEWYFLALFQFVKLGPALITSILVPAVLVIGLIFWPVLDARFGPGIARRLGWRSWPIPRHNRITGTMWIAGLGIIGLLTLWATFVPGLCLPWFFNGPVCGG